MKASTLTILCWAVDVTLDVWEGMWHVWQDHPSLPEAMQATAEIGAYFQRHLRPAPGIAKAAAMR